VVGIYEEQRITVFVIQGVRWRFQRLFCQVYMEAFEKILLIEKILGTELREFAVSISKERYELRWEVLNKGYRSAGDIKKK
jgi:hypothetical protein